MSGRGRRLGWLLLVVLLSAAPSLLAQHGAAPAAPAATGEPAPAEHGDPVSPVMAGLVLMLAAAKLGGSLFLRCGQPAVLGELVGGVVLGNLLLLAGLNADQAAASGGAMGAYASFVRSATTPGQPLDILARLGVVLLLFQVGLETDLGEMVRVGLSSFLVASIGVIVPFVLGFLVSYCLLPGQHDLLVHVFVGSVLCATSVGITARVFRELGRLDQDEARIVLGAAVIDDVMGLVVLAVVTGMVSARNTGGALNVLDVARILLLAVAFLVISVAGGRWLAPRAMKLTSRLQGEGLLLISALAICFILATVSGLIGLAPIVGAFAAGLLLDPVHYQDFREGGADHRIEDVLEPVTIFLVPLFFVQMGMTVRLETFADARVLGFAALLTVAAFAGKQACGLAVVGRGLDRLSVGLGMVPRGEVGLIVAAIGQQLAIRGDPMVSPMANTAIVIMVIVTTMVTPPLLNWSLRRGDRRRAAQAD